MGGRTVHLPQLLVSLLYFSRITISCCSRMETGCSLGWTPYSVNPCVDDDG